MDKDTLAEILDARDKLCAYCSGDASCESCKVAALAEQAVLEANADEEE